jgi:hypothetical protein
MTNEITFDYEDLEIDWDNPCRSTNTICSCFKPVGEIIGDYVLCNYYGSLFCKGIKP